MLVRISNGQVQQSACSLILRVRARQWQRYVHITITSLLAFERMIGYRGREPSPIGKNHRIIAGMGGGAEQGRQGMHAVLSTVPVRVYAPGNSAT